MFNLWWFQNYTTTSILFYLFSYYVLVWVLSLKWWWRVHRHHFNSISIDISPNNNFIMFDLSFLCSTFLDHHHVCTGNLFSHIEIRVSYDKIQYQYLGVVLLNEFFIVWYFASSYRVGMQDNKLSLTWFLIFVPLQ